MRKPPWTLAAEEGVPDVDRQGPLRRAWGLGLLLAGMYLVIALSLLPSYGPTWDCALGEYLFGHRLLEYAQTGDPAFLELTNRGPQPDSRSPHLGIDYAPATWTVARMPGALLSALSCKLFWTQLAWFSPMAAHHLPIPLLVATLIVVLVRFAMPRLGAMAAGSAVVFLVLAPRFFAHSFNNLKDVPETVLYSLSVLAGFLALVRGGRLRWLVFGGLLGLAVVQKANALFVPVQLALFALGLLAMPRFRSRATVESWAHGLPWGLAGFVVFHIAPFPPFWSRPIEGPWQLTVEMLRAGNRLSQSAVGFSSIGFGGAASISTHALQHFISTTPPALLLFAAVGSLARGLSPVPRLFLALGVAVPVGRTLLPGMRNYDGVRHFLEFYPFLCLLAGVGFSVTWRGLEQFGSSMGSTVSRLALTALAFVPALTQVVRTHPNGTCYFNASIGGLRGAQASTLPEATDYWGNSYWQALGWLNQHAEDDARILVPIASHIVHCAAPIRLRGDITFWRSQSEARHTVYVVYITRKGWYQPSLRALDRSRSPIHEIRVQGAPILRIHRLDSDDPWFEAWRADGDRRGQQRRLWLWLCDRPEELHSVMSVIYGLPSIGAEAAESQLREILPEELHVTIRPILELRMP